MAYLPVEKVEKLIGQTSDLLTVLDIEDIKQIRTRDWKEVI